MPETSVSPVRDWLRLALVPGVGPRLRQALLERFGSVSAIFTASHEALRGVAGIGPKLATALCAAATDDAPVDEELALCREHDVRLITLADDVYPRLLRELPDPPGVLYARGSLEPRDGLAIAIVGSRHATQYGRQVAARLAGSLARAGLTIVSGLARGIDGEAHRAALEAGGRTIAVLGSGVLNVYPPEHLQLAQQVASAGGVLSEQPARAAPLAGTFPQRNRLISGLTLGTIVVEASSRSGALITARHAGEQGREVFAVPGRIDSRMSHGCHRLLRDGAVLVESADDVLDALGPLVEAVPRDQGPPVHRPAELLLGEVEQRVLAAVGEEVTAVDQVVVASGLPTPQVLATLSTLEMRRLVRRLGGNRVARV
jgi:DNA processing protein